MPIKLKFPSHIHTADVFNVKRLIPFKGDHDGDAATDNLHSRAISFYPKGNDID